MKKYLLFSLFTIGLFASCKQNKDQDPQRLKDGRWHAEFEAKDGAIPFLFDVKDDSVDSLVTITLINGDERVQLQGVTYKGDSVFIPIDSYDTELRGIVQNDTLRGIFRKHFAENDPGIPFKAINADKARFSTDGVSNYSLHGKWDIQFISDSETKNNVGIFSVDGQKLTGSVLTNSGDLRYLEGVMDASGFRLSAFAGLSPYLIEGKFTDQDHFEGKFVTSRGIQSIKGTRNASAALADPYNLTKLKSGYKTVDFNFPDLQGKEVSLSDPRYKGKVVVLSVLGSWCPNCLDEMAYLSPWYKENKDRGVEIIGLSFERKDDPKYVNKVLTNLVKKYDTSYAILFAGKLGEEAKALPAIDGLKSFPTTIFIDKMGNVRKIHTGFNGPATGLFYDEFKKDFNVVIDELLSK